VPAEMNGDGRRQEKIPVVACAGSILELASLGQHRASCPLQEPAKAAQAKLAAMTNFDIYCDVEFH
jgi:hypothetical protein